MIHVGSFSEILEAKCNENGHPVAVKVSRKTPRAYNELEALKCLHHLNIVMLMSSVDESGWLYLIMELGTHGTLRHHYEHSLNVVPLTDTVRYFSEIVDGLAYVHHLGIIHRDVRVENVLLYGPWLTVKLCGFTHAVNMARLPDKDHKLPNTMPLMYLSPQSTPGYPRVASTSQDRWALGILLFYLLTGSRPWQMAAPCCNEFQMWKERGVFTYHIIDPDAFVVICGLLRVSEKHRFHVWQCSTKKFYVSQLDPSL